MLTTDEMEKLIPAENAKFRSPIPTQSVPRGSSPSTSQEGKRLTQG